MKLYNLPRDAGIRIYGLEPDGDKDGVVIFGHIDGMYSYCWVEGDQRKLVHLFSGLEMVKFKDGFKIKEEVVSGKG